MELWNKYLEYHPEIITRFDAIDEVSKNKFIRKLQSEKSKSNFSSTLTELSFYEFFRNNGFNVEYEKLLGGLTPDLTISKKGELIIAEVLKLNTTEKDTVRNEFESLLLEEIEKIKIGCWVQINFKEDYFDTVQFNQEEIATTFYEWLKSNCIAGKEIELFNFFTFKVIRVDKKYDHVCVFGNVNMIDIDVRRLNSDKSRFVQKMSMYNDLIQEKSLPYLICIRIDFHAAIGENEMFWTMYGDVVSHLNFGIQHCELNGFYYKNDLTKNLSGVLLMISDRVFFFRNFRQDKLFKEALDILMRFQFYNSVESKLTYLRRV